MNRQGGPGTRERAHSVPANHCHREFGPSVSDILIFQDEPKPELHKISFLKTEN